MALNVESRNGPVVDPYKNRERLAAWDGSLPGVSEHDATIIREYLWDMRDGINVTGKRGKRSPTRVLTIRSRMSVLARLIRTHLDRTLTTVTEEELLRLFARMRDGTIKNDHGKPYQSVADYAISFKAFWHWHMKRARKAGKSIPDITTDFDTSQEKPHFHYLTYEQVKRLADHASPYYRMLIWFLFDTGVRAPTELMNVRVRDIEKDREGNYTFTVRDETSKTFGRKPKLMLCGDMLATYIQTHHLQPNDFLFTKTPSKVNEQLGKLGWHVLKLGEAHVKEERYHANVNGERVAITKHRTTVRGGITMYDFRHASACYWLPRYKSEAALKYRFGWKHSDMIHYYTELLGMKDTITTDDLIDAEEKTQLHQELDTQRQRNARIEDELAQLQVTISKQEELLRAIIDSSAHNLVAKHHTSTTKRSMRAAHYK